MTEPRIEDREALPYLGIRRAVTDGVPALVDKAFPELYAWLAERGVAPAGPPFIRTHEVDARGEPLDLEVCAPIAAETEAERPVRRDALPEGRYLTMVHIGPYRSEKEADLGDARAELMRWADDRDVSYSRATDRGARLPCAVEHFRRGPVETSDHATWETELAFLVVT